MATPIVKKKFALVLGQSNATEVADARSWEDLHRYVALRSTENTEAQLKQFTSGSYSDTYRLPFKFFGGPQRDRLGENSFGSWQTANVMSRATQAIRFLTPYNPAASYTNVGTGNATNYPGTCELVASPVPTGKTFATNVRWQKDPVGLKLTRRRTGVEHTIDSGTSLPGSTISVTPPLVPPPEVGEQFDYEIAAGAASASDDELVLCNMFGGLQDIGSLLDSPSLNGSAESQKHHTIIHKIDTSAGTTACRVVMRTRPLAVGATLSFAVPTASQSLYLNLGGAAMSGTSITQVLAATVPWEVGDRIEFPTASLGGGTLPANIAADTPYYVVSVSGTNNETIEVSATQGGTPISVGAGFVAGAGGPVAVPYDSLPAEITAGTTYYVTRRDEDGATNAITSWGGSTLNIANHALGTNERVSFTGDLPAEITAGQFYYVRVNSTSQIGLAETFNGPAMTFTGGGEATMLREDSYYGFYISATRGGAEIVATSGTGHLPNPTQCVATAQESARGSLTGLQATCISGTAANVGQSRHLGDVYTDGTDFILKCETDWPATPQSGDKFTIEVPPLSNGQSVPFKHWAMMLPWCQFEGRAPYRGPGLISVGSASGSEAFVGVAGVHPPSVGAEVRMWTNGSLPSPFKPGRPYYVHTQIENALFLKDSYDDTDPIQGDDGGGASGIHTLTVHDQDGKVNPFPPGFNYPNHYVIPRFYQSFEGPSLIAQNPKIGIAPGLGLKLHEYHGEVIDMALCAVSGTSIGHKEVYANPSGATNYGWLDYNQHKSWSPGEENNVFARFLDVLESIKVAYAAEGADRGVTIEAECELVVFLQGEEDASHLPLANNYYRSGGQLRQAVREAIKAAGFCKGPAESIRWVWPKIRDAATAVTGTAPWPYATTVNNAIVQLVDEDPYSRTVEVSDLTMFDTGHYDGAGFSTLADRVYDAYTDMQRDGYSKVAIANMALGCIGDTSTILSLDPPDDTHQASVCAQWYDMALNKALSRHTWDFSKRRVSPVAVETDRSEWLFSYTLPKDFAGVVSVLPEGATDDMDYVGADARLEHDITNDTNMVRRLYCNSENVVLIYRAKVKDPTQWSEPFVQCLAWTWAAMIAGPILKGTKGLEVARACTQMAELYTQQATTFDAKTTRQKHVQDNRASWDRDSR